MFNDDLAGISRCSRLTQDVRSQIYAPIKLVADKKKQSNRNIFTLFLFLLKSIMFVGLTVSAWPGILSKMSQNKKLNTQREHRFRLREGNFQESVIKNSELTVVSFILQILLLYYCIKIQYIFCVGRGFFKEINFANNILSLHQYVFLDICSRQVILNSLKWFIGYSNLNILC